MGSEMCIRDRRYMIRSESRRSKPRQLREPSPRLRPRQRLTPRLWIASPVKTFGRTVLDPRDRSRRVAIRVHQRISRRCPHHRGCLPICHASSSRAVPAGSARVANSLIVKRPVKKPNEWRRPGQGARHRKGGAEGRIQRAGKAASRSPMNRKPPAGPRMSRPPRSHHCSELVKALHRDHG